MAVNKVIRELRMGPEHIKKLSEAGLKVQYAESALTSTKIEVRRPIEVRSYELLERYEEEGLSFEERERIGLALRERTGALLDTLWNVEENPAVTPLWERPSHETKRVTAPGYLEMHMTKITTDLDGRKPIGHIDISDRNGHWELHQNNVSPDGNMQNMTSPNVHARFEDDIATLEGIFEALELALPEAEEAQQ